MLGSIVFDAISVEPNPWRTGHPKKTSETTPERASDQSAGERSSRRANGEAGGEPAGLASRSTPGSSAHGPSPATSGRTARKPITQPATITSPPSASTASPASTDP